MITRWWLGTAILFAFGCGDDAPGAPNVGGSGGAGGDGGQVVGGDGGDGATGGEGGASGVCPEGFAMGDFYGKPTAQVTIDGAGPYSFIVDTGAPTTVIDLSLQAQLVGRDHEVDFAGQTQTMPLNYALDLEAVGVSGNLGIIGTDFLGQFALNLDYQRDRIWLTEGIDESALSACEHLAGTAESQDLYFDDHFYVQGSLESSAGWFLVDTGATFGGVGQSLFATLDAQHPRPSLSGFYTPAAIGTFWARLTRLGAVQVGEHRVDGILARTIPDGVLPTGPQDESNLGLLPSGFFRHFLVTLDYPAQVLRLDPYAGDSMSEPVGYYSVGIGLAEQLDEAVVAELVPGASAEQAGVMIGDRIVAVGGIPLVGNPRTAWAWSLTASSEGAAISLAIDRNGEPLTIDLTAENILVGPDR